MKRIRTILLYLSVLAATVFTTGCSSLSSSHKTWMEIQPGMTQQQVLSILGKPNYRRFNYNMEEWEYEKFSPINDNTIILIGFENNVVVNMNTFPAAPPAAPAPPQSNIPQVLPSYPDRPVGHPGHSTRPMRPMSDQEFQLLYKQLKRTSFSDDRLKIVQNAVNSQNFSSAQAAQLLGIFPFDDDKLKALTLMAPRLTDSENYMQVVDTFKFSSNKEKARKSLGKE